MMAEIDIANGCQRHQRNAQRALFDTYSPRLMAIALRYTGKRDDAQDVLQEALIKAFGNIDRFVWRGSGSFVAWLDRIVINTAVSYLRLQTFAATIPVDALADDVDDPSADQVASIDAETILGMVASLPDGYRTIFNMFCVDGFSHREIAQQLGISESTSSSQLSRARALLARQVKDYLNKQCYP